MCSKASPMGEEKKMTRTSMRIKNKKKQRETNNMEKSPWNNKMTKKPKLLSLKLEQRSSHCLNNLVTKKIKKRTKKQSKKKPDTTPFLEKKKTENLDDDQYETAAADLFNSATDSTISSIHDLLSSSITDCDRGKNLSPYDLQEHRSSSSSLLRMAMKKWASEEEETTEEQWVSYSEVMSQSGTPQWGGDGIDGRPSLALKLDYDQIMEAWSDKGTLGID